jgi:hypothetical protein
VFVIPWKRAESVAWVLVNVGVVGCRWDLILLVVFVVHIDVVGMAVEC